MALSLRRTSHEPRLELMPLLDVIFLLLTFFIYSQVMMIRAHVLPVKLPVVSAGQTTEAVRAIGITIDRTGAVFLNTQPVTMSELSGRLKQYAAQPEPPQVFVAVEDEPGGVDRGPLLVHLMEMLRNAGIEQFGIVGRPKQNDAP